MLFLCYPVIRIISVGDRSSVRQKNLCHISIGIICIDRFTVIASVGLSCRFLHALPDFDDAVRPVIFISGLLFYPFRNTASTIPESSPFIIGISFFCSCTVTHFHKTVRFVITIMNFMTSALGTVHALIIQIALDHSTVTHGIIIVGDQIILHVACVIFLHSFPHRSQPATRIVGKQVRILLSLSGKRRDPALCIIGICCHAFSFSILNPCHTIHTVIDITIILLCLLSFRHCLPDKIAIGIICAALHSSVRIKCLNVVSITVIGEYDSVFFACGISCRMNAPDQFILISILIRIDISQWGYFFYFMVETIICITNATIHRLSLYRKTFFF